MSPRPSLPVPIGPTSSQSQTQTQTQTQPQPSTQPPSSPQSQLYDTDFYAWIQEQIARLHDRQWQGLDVIHLIEELEALGKQQQRELCHRLAILLGHLLKWEYQPQRRSRSWLATIRVQRRDIGRLLADSPSLKAYWPEAVAIAYENGRDLAMGETNLPASTFPATCPYGLQPGLTELLPLDLTLIFAEPSQSNLLNPDFFPGPPHTLS